MWYFWKANVCGAILGAVLAAVCTADLAIRNFSSSEGNLCSSSSAASSPSRWGEETFTTTPSSLRLRAACTGANHRCRSQSLELRLQQALAGTCHEPVVGRNQKSYPVFHRIAPLNDVSDLNFRRDVTRIPNRIEMGFVGHLRPKTGSPASLSICRHPRRDLNPCYRRESITPGHN